MRNNSAPPKWSKLWTDAPKPGDRIGAYTPEQLEQMNQEFTAAVERAFCSGGESFFAASRTYDVRRRRSRILAAGVGSTPLTFVRPAMKWEHSPNLRRRPPTPSKNRGPVQVRIRRAFLASDAEVLSSSAIYDWTHPRRRCGRSKTLPAGIYWGTLQVPDDV